MGSLFMAMVLLFGLPVISGHNKVIDLTRSLGSDSVYWPGNPDFNFTTLSRGNASQHWYESNWFATAEHGGTHIDAPSHFFKDRWRLHDIPPKRLIGPAVVIDVTSKVDLNSDYRVSQEDFEAYETEHGEIPYGAIVIMNSGWESRYPDKKRVFNTNQTDTPSTFHFPGFHEDSVSWLVANRNVSMVGVDTPSTDYGQSTTFNVHVILGMNNIPGLENVANIGSIPKKGALITVGAVKLLNGSGGPARILATFSTHPKRCGCKPPVSGAASSVAGVLLLVATYIAVIALSGRQ